MPELSVIIPTKDRGYIFCKSYQQIVEASLKLDVEILVINNSLTPVVIPNKPENFSVYDNPNNKNSVFSSRNYGASIARSPILLFVDDDILVTKESLEYLLKFHAEHSSACLNVNWVYPSELLEKIRKTVFGRYLIKHGFTAMKSLYGKGWKDNELFTSDTVASFFFCIKKKDFDRVGGYNETHLHEGTDVDLSNKMHDNDISIWINPLIMVNHNEEDRVEITNWLERKKRLGEIYRQATDMGKGFHRQNYSSGKRVIYGIIYSLQPFFLSLIKLCNNLKIDAIGFFLIDVLLGANMCHGYYSAKK